jgi:NADH-quinone oxidoreductase subunit M
LGVDGISIFFVLLSTFLVPLCIVATWNSIDRRVREYMLAFLLLESFMIGTFCALDMVVFYIFFEATLIPMYMIIGGWGGENRSYACVKFFLYTLLGSVLLLIAIAKIYGETGTTDFFIIKGLRIRPHLQYWVWWPLFIAFAVKIPMWPLHTWLPDAHVEAPTSGSVILAGVLLKLGGYGMARFMLPLIPEANQYYAPVVLTLSTIAIIYTSFVALAQNDIKKLIAYSSVAHMGFVTLGLFTFTHLGVTGAIIQMLSHGIISAAMFLCVGVIYDRCHTRDIAKISGLANAMPKLSFFIFIFSLASIGLPGTSGFLGEFLTLLGAYSVNNYFACIAVFGVLLGACYMLWFYGRVCFGVSSPIVEQIKNKKLTLPELLVLSTLALMIFGFGIYPRPILDVVKRTVRQTITERYDAKLKTITW